VPVNALISVLHETVFRKDYAREPVINNAQVLHLSMAKTVGMEGLEGKVDCATRIERHKLAVYKTLFTFSQSIMYAN
jgi:hypothetical protein